MKNSFRTILAAAALGAAFTAGGTHRAEAGEYCREYTRTVIIGGSAQQAYGTACLEPDGAWRVADESLNEPAEPQYATYGEAVSHERARPVPYDGDNVTYVIQDGPRLITAPRIRYVRYYAPPPPVLAYNYVRYDGHRGWDHGWDRRWDRGHGHHGRGPWDRRDRD